MTMREWFIELHDRWRFFLFHWRSRNVKCSYPGCGSLALCMNLSFNFVCSTHLLAEFEASKES